MGAGTIGCTDKLCFGYTLHRLRRYTIRIPLDHQEEPSVMCINIRRASVQFSCRWVSLDEQQWITFEECRSRHWDQIVASDFFTIEVWTSKGLQRYLVLFFIE